MYRSQSPGRRTASLATGACLALAVVLAAPVIAGAHAKAKSSPNVSKLKKELKAIDSKLSSGQHKPFQATYSSTYGQAASFTFAQSGGKTLFKTASATIINNGKQTLYCSTSAGHATCVAETTATNPFATLEELFSPQTAMSYVQSAEAEVVAKRSGYTVKFATATIGGQRSHCISVSGPSGSGKDCVNASGVLDFVSTAAGHVEMTKFTTSVAASAFTPPAGATVDTIPSSVTLS